MNRIKEFRQQAGMKQQELADVLSVKQTTVSGWEVGRREPDFDSLKRMADIFNCSIDELLGQKEKPVVKDDGLNQKLEKLSDRNLQRLEDYIDILLETQGE